MQVGEQLGAFHVREFYVDYCEVVIFGVGLVYRLAPGFGGVYIVSAWK